MRWSQAGPRGRWAAPVGGARGTRASRASQAFPTTRAWLGALASRPKTPSTLRGVIATVLLMGFSGPLWGDYLKHYFDGREAYRNQKYRESVVFLDRAIKLQPNAGERVRWTGTHFETYLPHFHLGRALYQLGLYDDAIQVWNESVRQGPILKKGNKRQNRELQRQLEVMEREHFPEELERLRREVETTEEQLELLAARGIGGLATSDPELDQVASLLDGARDHVAAARAQGSFKTLSSADDAIAEARAKLLRAAEALEQRDAQRRRDAARLSYGRAVELLRRGECSPEATTLLYQLMADRYLATELRSGDAPLLVLLARAHQQCADLLGAEQFLELALLERVGDADGLRGELQQIQSRRRGRQLGTMLANWEDELRAERCVEAVDGLDELRASAMSEGFDPGQRLAVELLLTRALLDCGMTLEATDALERARATAAGAADEIRELQQRLAGLAEQSQLPAAEAARKALRLREQRRTTQRAVSDYLMARTVVELRGCDRQAIATMESTAAVVATWTGLQGQPALRPNVDLAQAWRACRDREQTQRYLALADREAKSRDDVKRLATWLEQGEGLDIYTESHALVVGISRYEAKGWEPLPEVRDDVAQVDQLLRSHGFSVRKLLDPDSDELQRSLRSFFGKKQSQNTRLVFYYGGHGHTELNDFLRLGYIVPADAPFPEDDPDGNYLSYVVSMDGFEGFAKMTPANHAMFLFDSCFSGTIFDSTESRFRMRHRAATKTAETLSKPARLFVTAGDETQMVPAQSVFRAAVIRALEGFADADTDGLVLGAELGSFVSKHGASPRNTPQWGMLASAGFDTGDVAFSVPDYDKSDARSSATTSLLAAELVLWQLVAGSPSPANLQTYLERHPHGRFAELAVQMQARTP